jgi:hypothetical protein
MEVCGLPEQRDGQAVRAVRAVSWRVGLGRGARFVVEIRDAGGARDGRAYRLDRD